MMLDGIIECLQIAAKYSNPAASYVSAGRDQIWFLDDDGITPEDQARLKELGANKDDEGWSLFT